MVLPHVEGFQGGICGKEPACKGKRCRRYGFSLLDWKGPLEESITTCSHLLAWRIPGTEEPGAPNPVGSQIVEHD